jgi:hypothetical protein
MEFNKDFVYRYPRGVHDNPVLSYLSGDYKGLSVELTMSGIINNYGNHSMVYKYEPIDFWEGGLVEDLQKEEVKEILSKLVFNYIKHSMAIHENF